MAHETNIIHGPPVEQYLPKETSFSGHLLNSLKKHGNQEILVYGTTGESMTGNQLLQKSINLAVSLRRLGVRKGDVICLSSENRFEFAITEYAAIYIGAVITAINPAYTTGEIKHAFKLSKPSFVFCSPLTAVIVKQTADEVSNIKEFVLFGDRQVIQAKLFNDLVSKDEDVDSFKPAEINEVEDVLAILYSSGTTGMAKGVVLTHSNFTYTVGYLLWSMTATGRFSGTTLFSVMPWFHAYGFTTNIIYPSLGYKLVFAVKFEPDSFLRIIQEQKANSVFTVPPLVLFLAKHPSIAKYDLSSVKELWCGAAPLSKELQEAAVKRLNLEYIKQGYGLTECTLGVLIDISGGKKVGSSGQAGPGTQVKVVDLETGEALGPYKEGEICVKSGSVMKGYAGDPTSTSATIDKDGWLHTGDICYYDNEHYFFIIDRLKELIKYKGFQVPPAELEAILIQHKGIKEAAVIGIPNDEAGELPLAFVVKEPNSNLTEEEVKAFVAAKVTHTKRLRGGVRFVKDIPKNPSGKILRRQLREQLKLEGSSKL